MFFDKDEYKSEIKSLKNSAQYLSLRDNLRIGIVDDQKLIKRLKIKFGKLWFPDVGMSGCVMKRYDGKLRKYDIASEININFNYWINKDSLKEVDFLSGESFKIYELLR